MVCHVGLQDKGSGLMVNSWLGKVAFKRDNDLKSSR